MGTQRRPGLERAKQAETVGDIGMPIVYVQLIEGFLNGSVSVEAFEERFLSLFKAEPKGLDEPIYEILNKLFTDVDCYSAECLPGAETAWEISEVQLRREAARALEQLRDYEGPEGHTQ